MRKLYSVVSFLFIVTLATSQPGKVYLKNSNVRFNAKNVFVYQPPANLKLPDTCVVRVIEPWKKSFSVITLLTKINNQYEFVLDVADSTQFIDFAIFDLNDELIDNNNNKAYNLNINQFIKTDEDRGKLKIIKMNVCQFENYFLKTNFKTDSILVNEYEQILNNYPNLKDSYYSGYLYLKYQNNKKETKPIAISYAKKLELKGDEQSLVSAWDLYRVISDTAREGNLTKIIIEKFPTGDVAKNEFIKQIYKNNRIDSLPFNYYLNVRNEFVKRFSDSTSGYIESLLRPIILSIPRSLSIDSVDKYEKLFPHKMELALSYNNTAWNLVEGNLDSTGHHLNFAEYISKRSLDIIRDTLNKTGDFLVKRQLQQSYNMYADTYALIMFKLGKYQEAFNFQDEIRKQNALSGEDESARYAVYAEKVKGAEYAKNYLEATCKNGTFNGEMFKLLHQFYNELNIPETTFIKVRNASLKAALLKDKEKNAKAYGGLHAKEFSLFDIYGNTIKLSDLKGKIVMLDFWATWCGPCIASFPAMQKLVRQYKDDANVQIFFVDSFEHFETNNEKHDKVKAFINSKNYNDFHVLFDDKTDVAKAYNINVIPTKLIIDKDGNIAYSYVGAELNEEKLLSTISAIVEAMND